MRRTQVIHDILTQNLEYFKKSLFFLRFQQKT